MVSSDEQNLYYLSDEALLIRLAIVLEHDLQALKLIDEKSVDKYKVFTERGDKIYPCSDCGKLRSKEEGGEIFTVCDTCWDNKPK